MNKPNDYLETLYLALKYFVFGGQREHADRINELINEQKQSITREKYGTTNIVEIARMLFPNATAEELEFILQEKTAFPLDNELTLRQLEKLVETHYQVFLK